VTDTAGLDLNQDFAGCRVGQLHVFDDQRGPGLLEQGCLVRGGQRHDDDSDEKRKKLQGSEGRK
jgi:hypothetical protein